MDSTPSDNLFYAYTNRGEKVLIYSIVLNSRSLSTDSFKNKIQCLVHLNKRGLLCCDNMFFLDEDIGCVLYFVCDPRKFGSSLRETLETSRKTFPQRWLSNMLEILLVAEENSVEFGDRVFTSSSLFVNPLTQSLVLRIPTSDWLFDEKKSIRSTHKDKDMVTASNLFFAMLGAQYYDEDEKQHNRHYIFSPSATTTTTTSLPKETQDILSLLVNNSSQTTPTLSKLLKHPYFKANDRFMIAETEQKWWETPLSPIKLDSTTTTTTTTTKSTLGMNHLESNLSKSTTRGLNSNYSTIEDDDILQETLDLLEDLNPSISIQSFHTKHAPNPKYQQYSFDEYINVLCSNYAFKT